MDVVWKRVVGCIVILTLAFPTASAQTDTIEITFDPTVLDLTPGSSADVQVRLTNRGIMATDLTVTINDVGGGMNVTLNATRVALAAGETKHLTARVSATNAGNWSARFNADDGASVAPQRGQGTLLVRVQPPGTSTNETSSPDPNDGLPIAGDPPRGNENRTPPDNGTSTPPSNESTSPATNQTSEPAAPPPTGSPADDAATENTTSDPPAPPARPLHTDISTLELASSDGNAVPFEVIVRNPSERTQTATIALRLPLGWGGTLTATTIDIPAGGSGRVAGQVMPTSEARDGEGSLDIMNEAGGSRIRLFLHAPAPVAAEPQAETTNEAPQPSSADAPAAVDAPAADMGPATPLVRMEPREVGAPPGASILVTLIIENPGPAPLEGHARLDMPPLQVSPEGAPFRVEAYSSALLTFTLTIGEDLAAGSTYDGAATVELPYGQTPAPLRVRVTGASPTLPGADPGTAPDALAVAVVALAGVGTLATAGAALWRRWPTFGLFALYARLAPSRALEHPRRARMLATLRATPGLTLAELQRASGLTNGVVRHHVSLLESAGAIRSVQDGALRRLYPMDAQRVSATPPLGERALAMLADRGPMRSADLAAELGVTRQALHYHVKRLEADGRIRARREQAEVVLEPAAS